jgi:hypothetical protein
MSCFYIVGADSERYPGLIKTRSAKLSANFTMIPSDRARSGSETGAWSRAWRTPSCAPAAGWSWHLIGGGAAPGSRQMVDRRGIRFARASAYIAAMDYRERAAGGGWAPTALPIHRSAIKEARTMKKSRRRAAQALANVIASILALGAEPALGAVISECTTIGKPGSYVLTRNLTAAGDCVVIAADFVTLDLAGWVITGDGSTGRGVTGGGRGITVRNGTVTGFSLGVMLGAGAVVEKVRAIDNGGDGAGIATGSSSMISGNTVSGSPFPIAAGFGSTISGNTTRGGPFGITAGNFSTVSGNNVVGGGVGIFTGFGSIVSGNTSSGSDPSIFTGLGSIVSGNIAAGPVGILAGLGSMVNGNTAKEEGNGGGGSAGIVVDCPSNVIGNTATGYSNNLVLSGAGCTNIDNLAPPEPAELHWAIEESRKRKLAAIDAQLRQLGVDLTAED